MDVLIDPSPSSSLMARPGHLMFSLVMKGRGEGFGIVVRLGLRALPHRISYERMAVAAMVRPST
jgi:hypothetical protein